MTATSSVEILKDLIKNPPQDKEYEAVAAEIHVNNFYGYQDTLFSIHALSLFVQNLDRVEVLRHISKNPWIEQHEILTRWAWMTSQKKEIENGKTFNHPYLCNVGRRDGRETLDREFDTFRLFLTDYCKDTKTEYWFYKKLQSPNDPPDFVAVDKQGNKIGIEITEAPLNEKSSYQEKQGEIVRQKLKEDFPGLNCTIEPIASDDQIDWLRLLKNYEELKNWICQISRQTFYNSDLGIRMSIRRYEPESNSSIATGSPRPFGYTDEHKASKAICNAIKKKVEKNSIPKIKPCILVIYENTSLMIVDKRLVADLVSENLKAQWQRLYEEVWFVKGCTGERLLPREVK